MCVCVYVCMYVCMCVTQPDVTALPPQVLGTGDEASPTKSRSGTLYDDSGSSDSEYSSGEEEEEGEVGVGRRKGYM